MAGMSDEDGTQKLKRMVYIFDSMTTKELDSDGKIFLSEPARMTRIACGSGTSVREVEELLTQHKVMSGLAKNMGQNKKNMQRAQNMLGGGNRQQQLAAMQKRMAALGGAGRGGMGGDMGKMLEMMGGGMGGGMPNMGGMDMNAMMSQMGNMFGGAGGGRGRGR